MAHKSSRGEEVSPGAGWRGDTRGTHQNDAKAAGDTDSTCLPAHMPTCHLPTHHPFAHPPVHKVRGEAQH